MKWSKIVFATGIFFVVLLVVVPRFRLTLALQQLFGVPGKEFYVGSARVVKPDGWLLSSSRDVKGGEVKYLGVLPGWIYSTKGASEGRYFEFMQLGEEKISIAFTEMEASRKEGMTRFIAEDLRADGCRISERALSAMRGVECSDADSVVIYLPEVGLTVIVLGSPSPQFTGLHIEKVKP